MTNDEKPTTVTPSQPELGSVSEAIGMIWGCVFVLAGFFAFVLGAAGVGLALVTFGLLILPQVVARFRKAIPALGRPFRPAVAALIVATGMGILNPLGTLRGRGENAESAPSAPGNVELEIQALWSELTTVTQQCDQAATKASGRLDLSQSSLVGVYAAVDAAKAICGNVGLQVMGIDAPRSLNPEKRRAFDDALNDCGLAYAGKSVMFDRMLKVVDGDRRPSRIAAVQEAAQTSQAQTFQCIATISALANAEGVVLADAKSGSSLEQVSN